MNLKRAGWFAVSTFMILLLLYFADPTKFISQIQRADKLILAAAILAGLLVIPVWANSWYHLINRVGPDISFYRALKLFTAGNFLNAVTPLGQFGGEPLMAYVINKNTDASYEDALSAVISADMINAVPIATFFIGGLFFLIFTGTTSELVVELAQIGILVVFFGGSIAYLLWFRSESIKDFVNSVLRKFTAITGKGDAYADKIEERMEGLQKAFRDVGAEPVELAKITVLAHIFFVFQIISLYLVMLSIDVNTDLAPLYVVLPLASLANFSPTPGGSGTYEVALAGILTTFLGVGGSAAVTISILYRFTTFWPGVLIGYISVATLTGIEDRPEQ